MSQPIFIRCSCCEGTGRRELTGEFADTLRYVRRNLGRGEFTAAEVARLMKIKPTAMSNRLAYLELAGFLTSRQYGRRRLFRNTGT